MVAEIRTELLRDGEAVPLGRVTPDGLPGTLSSDPHRQARRIFLFGWREGAPGVWESHGVDTETPAMRHLLAVELTLLSDLSSPYEQEIHRRGQLLGTVRFTLVGDP